MKKILLSLPCYLVFLFWVLALNLKGAANATLFLLFICSVAFWGKMKNDSLRHWALLLALPLGFALLQKGLGFDFKNNAFDAPSRFLIAGACIFMFYQMDATKLSRSIIGCILGALGVGIWAYCSTHFESLFWFEGERAWNGFSNPIPFGVLSLLLGFLALNVPHSWFQKIPASIFIALKILAFLSAFYAAYLSLSRVALLVLPFLALVLMIQHAQTMKKTFLLVTVVLVTLLMATDNPYQKRMLDGFNEVAQFNQNPNTSMGLRFVMWQEALQIIQRHPTFGIGKARFAEEMKKNPNHPLAYELSKAPHPHNEYLNFGVEFGIPGLCLALLLYFAPLLFFCKHLKNKNLIIQNAAANGSMVVLTFMVSGLLDCYFWIANQCTFYGLSVALFVALILKEKATVNI